MSDPMKPSAPRRSDLAGRFLVWVIVAGVSATIALSVVWLAKVVLLS